MDTCRAINYAQWELFYPPEIDYTENCPEDSLGPGCQLAADNNFDFVIAVVNSDVNVADNCKNMTAKRFAVGTFHPTANDLQQFQSDPHNFKKVFQFQFLFLFYFYFIFIFLSLFSLFLKPVSV
jgi:hypothetical protein